MEKGELTKEADRERIVKLTAEAEQSDQGKYC